MLSKIHTENQNSINAENSGCYFDIQYYGSWECDNKMNDNSQKYVDLTCPSGKPA